MVAGLLVGMHRRALRAVDGGRGTFHIGCRDLREELVLAVMESIAEGCAARVRAAVQVRRGPLVERALSVDASRTPNDRPLPVRPVSLPAAAIGVAVGVLASPYRSRRAGERPM